MVGGERTLREELSKLDDEEIQRRFPEIEWHFNPPLGSHFGGHFERKIRTMKDTFYSVMSLPSVVLTHAELLTLCSETEAIMNQMPLIERHPRLPK